MGVGAAPGRVQTVRYSPRGAAADLITNRDPETCISGPAGTGKTMAGLWKFHLGALVVPGMRALVVRQTHASLTGTTLVTFERQVAAEALGNGIVSWSGGGPRTPPQYRYENGSVILVGGLDRPEKFLSSEFDRILVDEANQITETAYETLLTRLRGTAPAYKQMITMCNPDRPNHWLRQRQARGALTMLHARHTDNPALINPDGTYTARGADYMARLDALTGVRRLRLRDGIWAAAEGVIYEEWDEAVHVIDRFDVPPDWPRFWSIDFGFVHPFVWQDWTRRPDGGLVLVREIYHTGRIVADHCRAIKRLHTADGTEHGRWNSPRPQFIVADHDAEDRATFEREMGLGVTPANKNVSEGIQAFAQRLRPAPPYARPRVEFMRDACVEVDATLLDAKAPTCTVEEIPGYVWAEGKEQPVKELDDGADCARYLVAEFDLRGQTNIRWG